MTAKRGLLHDDEARALEMPDEALGDDPVFGTAAGQKRPLSARIERRERDTAGAVASGRASRYKYPKWSAPVVVHAAVIRQLLYFMFGK